jgi:hypothetical protein
MPMSGVWGNEVDSHQVDAGSAGKPCREIKMLANLQEAID